MNRPAITDRHRIMIHLFNGFLNPNAGSEQEALQLFELLSRKTPVQMWATSSRASKELLAKYPIRRLSPSRGAWPRGGTYIFIGAHWRNRVWPYLAPAPERLIYVFNTLHPKVRALTETHPVLLRWPKTEYVFISAFQAQSQGMRGEIHPSPIDIARFSPRLPRHPRAKVVVGRLSRDSAEKHDPADLLVYEALAHAGCDVLLQGATSLAGALPEHQGIRLLPEGAKPAEDFLHDIDIFYYRSGTAVETFGRVVIEAMACGLPVLCERRGGYTDIVRHGENGFLFDTSEEALALLKMLIAEPATRARIGHAARSTIEALYSRAAVDARMEFYLRPLAG
jgi:glycosyltransferase involved in cell wall biosynthesis